MSLTSPMCPAGQQLVAQSRQVAGGASKALGTVEIKITHTRPGRPIAWTEEARTNLGISEHWAVRQGRSNCAQVDPRVDFASKKMLGSPEHPAVTIHFLNSILKPKDPVVDVIHFESFDRQGSVRTQDNSFGHPGQGLKWADYSISKCRHAFLYVSPTAFSTTTVANYWQQLHEGDGYIQLRPAISISLVDRRMFTEPAQQNRWQHSFRLRCDQDLSLVMTDDFEFHIIELPKFQPESD